MCRVFGRLLFPTDFSRQADQLAGCLHEMKALGVEEIILLNVVELGPQIGFASDTFEKMLAWKQDAKVRLDEIKRGLEATGIRARWRIELGKPAVEIVRIAAEERVDLIVMGTHGHGFLRGALLGSVSHDVIRNAPVPVLALKVAVLDNLPNTECAYLCQHVFRRILLPTDFSDCASQALWQVKELRAAGIKEAVVPHVREESRRVQDEAPQMIEAKMQQIRSQLEFFGFSVTTIVLSGDPATAISDTVAGLLVSRIDAAVETAQYTQEVLADAGKGLDEKGLALLEEDLRSPCTEEIAVFRAFARRVDEGNDGFVVIDTAPTGHTLLLLDAANAYHREVQRNLSYIPDSVKRLLPQLRDPDFTKILIVTLPEATPVHEAERLQDDLRRAGIAPFAWNINQSFVAAGTRDPVLAERGALELRYIEETRQKLASRTALIPWQAGIGTATIAETVEAV